MGPAYEGAHQGTKTAADDGRSGFCSRLRVFVGVGSQYCVQRESDRSADYSVASAPTIHPL